MTKNNLDKIFVTSYVNNKKNAELISSMPLCLRSLVIWKIKKFVQEKGLDIENVGVIEFNKEGNFFEINISLKDNKKIENINMLKKGVYPNPNGRSISLRIYNKNSKLGPSRRDILERHEVVINTIEYYLKFILKLNPQKCTLIMQDLNKISKGVPEKSVLSSLTDDELITKKNLNLINTRFRKNIIKILKTKFADVLPNINEYNFFSKIRESEKTYLSNRKRKIYMNLYQGVGEDSNSWTFESIIPLSDVSSAKRDGYKKILPNWWNHKVSQIIVKNNKIYSDNESESNRSSSATVFSFKGSNIAKKKINKEIARKKVSYDIAHDIIKLINSGRLINKTEISNLFKPNYLYLTLLSPVALNSNKSPKLINKLLGGETNEANQLKDTILSFQNMNFKMSNAAIEYIINSSNKGYIIKNFGSINNFKLYLKKNNCKPVVNHQNNGVNTLKNLDRTNLEKVINKKTEAYLSKAIANKFRLMCEDNDAENIGFLLLEGKLNCTWKDEIKPAIKFMLKKYEDGLNNEKLDIKQRNIIKQKIKLLSCLIIYKDLYSSSRLNVKNILNLVKNASKSDFATNLLTNKQKKYNYVKPAVSLMLADILGIKSHVTCKSGEDRTGQVFVVKNALNKVLNDYIDNKSSSLKLSDIVSNSKFFEEHLLDPMWKKESHYHYFSASNHINKCCNPGAGFMQGLHPQILKGVKKSRYKELKKRDIMAKNAKGFYKGIKSKSTLKNRLYKFDLLSKSKLGLVKKNVKNKNFLIKRKRNNLFSFCRKVQPLENLVKSLRSSKKFNQNYKITTSENKTKATISSRQSKENLVNLSYQPKEQSLKITSCKQNSSKEIINLMCESIIRSKTNSFNISSGSFKEIKSLITEIKNRKPNIKITISDKVLQNMPAKQSKIIKETIASLKPIESKILRKKLKPISDYDLIN